MSKENYVVAEKEALKELTYALLEAINYVGDTKLQKKLDKVLDRYGVYT